MVRQFRSRRIVLAIFCAAAQLFAATASDTRPHVVLVSLDGFRHDYVKRYKTRHLLKLAEKGASADALRPGFPTMTFSSHYSMVTGVHAERHGIVDNGFYDPQTGEEYQFSQNAQEGKWYRRAPLWVLAEQQGIRTATYSWPGSEAEIEGVRPSIWRKYREQGTKDQQVDQAIEWLRLPPDQRPRLVILYFSAVDTVGHKLGPDAPEMQGAVEDVDRIVGRLHQELQQLPLRVNLIIVSDHGMTPIDGHVALREFTDLTRLRVVQGGGSIVHLYAPTPEVREEAYRDLKGKSPAFDVYRRAETPPHWHYTRDPRIGDLVVVATGPKVLNAGLKEAPARSFPTNKGAHGYDVRLVPDMNGIFFAAGPNIRPGRKLAVFDTVDVYPFVARIVGIKIPSDIDGKWSVLRPIYRN